MHFMTCKHIELSQSVEKPEKLNVSKHLCPVQLPYRVIGEQRLHCRRTKTNLSPRKIQDTYLWEHFGSGQFIDSLILSWDQNIFMLFLNDIRSDFVAIYIYGSSFPSLKEQSLFMRCTIPAILLFIRPSLLGYWLKGLCIQDKRCFIWVHCYG